MLLFGVPPNRLLPPVLPKPVDGLFCPNIEPPVLVLVFVPNPDEAVLLAPKLPKPPVVAVVLPNKPPPVEAGAPKAVGFGAPKPVFEVPNPPALIPVSISPASSATQGFQGVSLSKGAIGRGARRTT